MTRDLTPRDRTKIHAQAVENPSGALVIFVTGLVCTMTAFGPVFGNPMLLATLYMVRFDPRAHGLSGKPLTLDFYTSDHYADDLKAVIEGFNLNKPFFAGWKV